MVKRYKIKFPFGEIKPKYSKKELKNAINNEYTRFCAIDTKYKCERVESDD